MRCLVCRAKRTHMTRWLSVGQWLLSSVEIQPAGHAVAMPLATLGKRASRARVQVGKPLAGSRPLQRHCANWGGVLPGLSCSAAPARALQTLRSASQCGASRKIQRQSAYGTRQRFLARSQVFQSVELRATNRTSHSRVRARPPSAGSHTMLSVLATSCQRCNATAIVDCPWLGFGSSAALACKPLCVLQEVLCDACCLDTDSVS